jgi:hypothetical protein
MDQPDQKLTTERLELRSPLGMYLARVTFLLQSVLFVVSVGLSVLAISELAARESVFSQIQARIAENRANYVDLTRSEVRATGGPSAAASAPLTSDETRRLQYNALIEISELSSMRSQLQSLLTVGVEPGSLSLRDIISRLQRLGREPQASAQNDSSTSSALQKLRNAVTDLSSDTLLALAVMLSGAIGAMIASLRSGTALSLRAFVLGVASGFVTFLVLKGGKNVLLFQTPDQVLMFNPYGAAFAGLLAGLFTERAHQVLSLVVDDFVERIRGASQVRK